MKFYRTILIIIIILNSCEENELNIEVQDNKLSNTEYTCEGV